MFLDAKVDVTTVASNQGNAVSGNMCVKVLYGHASGTTYSVNACASQCGETFHIQKAACNPAQTVATKVSCSIDLLCWEAKIRHVNNETKAK